MELKDGLVGLGDMVLKSVLPGALGNAISLGLHALSDDERKDPTKIAEVVRTQLSATETVDLFKAAAADKQDARSMQKLALERSPKASFIHGITPPLLSFAVTGLLGWMIYSLFSGSVPAENRELFIYLSGTVTGIVLTTYAFWFGSSDKKGLGRAGDM